MEEEMWIPYIFCSRCGGSNSEYSIKCNSVTGNIDLGFKNYIRKDLKFFGIVFKTKFFCQGCNRDHIIKKLLSNNPFAI